MATQKIDILIEGGKATAAPPLGPALGPTGVNIGQVVADINKKTADFKGMQVPVSVEVDTDSKTYTITLGTPPASALIKKETGIQKGAGAHATETPGDLTIEQAVKIAKMKSDGLLGKNLKQRVKEIIGSARSMGLTVEGMHPAEANAALAQGKFDDKLR